MNPAKRRRRLQSVLPALYIALAVFEWVRFTRINHDGLANIGLFLVTLPVSLLILLFGWLVGRSTFLMPSGFGYLADHALYYVPAVAAITLLFWWIGRGIDRWRMH